LRRGDRNDSVLESPSDSPDTSPRARSDPEVVMPAPEPASFMTPYFMRARVACAEMTPFSSSPTACGPLGGGPTYRDLAMALWSSDSRRAAVGRAAHRLHGN